MIPMPEQVRRKTVLACQTAIAKGGVAVLIVPVDIAHANASDDVPYSVHTNVPVVRPSDGDLDRVADILNSAGDKVAIYGLAERQGRYDDACHAAEDRVGSGAWNGPCIRRKPCCRAIHLRVRHDPRKLIALAGLSGHGCRCRNVKSNGRSPVPPFNRFSFLYDYRISGR
jgi:hypothetical protein